MAIFAHPAGVPGAIEASRVVGRRRQVVHRPHDHGGPATRVGHRAVFAGGRHQIVVLALSLA
jgi:hypothetical protein